MASENASPEACAEFHLTESEATFKVTNFVAAVVATETQVNGRPSYREISSGPIMSVGHFRFAITIMWGVDANGNPDKSTKVGISGRRVDDTSDPCIMSMSWKLINSTECKSLKVVDKGFFRLREARGFFPWSNSTLTLADVLDPSKGWLHDGTLLVWMKFSVVTDFTTTSTASSDAVDNQQELADHMKGALESKLFADVTIEVGDTKIDAHRTILAARSPVFAAMLSAGMREEKDRRVVVEGLTTAAVRDMILYLYTGNVSRATLETDDLCMDLLQAAHRYQVHGLVNRCADVIGRTLNVDIVCDRLAFADLLGCEKLKTQCLAFINQHMAEVQRTQAYANLSRIPKLLMDIIAMIAPPLKRQRTEHS